MSPAEGRGRGRPAGSTGDTRERILDVARAHLAAKGFAGSSMRAIAREAEVDPSLISHYFGDKSGLLVATMALPFNPLERLVPVLAGGVDGMGVRLITTFLTAWDPHREVLSALLRTSIGSDDPPTTPVLQLVRNVIVTSLRDRIGGEDSAIRATLVAAQLVGLATTRYVAQLDPVATAPIEQVARWYGPAVQELVTPSER